MNIIFSRFLNNEKADRIWEEIKPKLKFDQPVPTEFALSHNRFRPKIKIHPNRERFFQRVGKGTLFNRRGSSHGGMYGTGSETEKEKRKEKSKRILHQLKANIKRLIPVGMKCFLKNLRRI